MKLSLQKYIPSLLLFLFLCSIQQSEATTVTVLVASGGLRFVPATTNINVNDSVLWSWSASGHSSTSDTSLWDSTVSSQPHTFTHQFPTAGTFAYHCIPHQSFGMVASIVVSAASNNPPTVSFTNPASGRVFSAPADIALRVQALDSDGTITNVQFSLGGTTLTNLSAPPFNYTNFGSAAGPYTFTAIASDNGGSKATNSVSVTVINPSPLVISNPTRPSTTNYKFNYAADVGLSYQIQTSGDLSVSLWTSIATNIANNTNMQFSDTNATNNRGYYRVGRLPNP